MARAASLAALLAGLGPLQAPAMVNARPSFATGATASPGTVAPGETASITASVQGPADDPVAVDVEVYDAGGAKVLERAFEDQSLRDGTQRYSISWPVPAAASPGAYSVEIGVFSSDWDTEYTWNDEAAQFWVATPAAIGAPADAAPPPAGPAGADVVAASAPAAAGGPVAGLHVSGNQILNGSGQPVRLRGVNRSGAEYMCSEGRGIFDGPMDEASVQAMLSWNINAVRIPLNEDCWLGINGVNPGYAGSTYQDAVAGYVSLLTSHNIAAIMNLHYNSPGGQLATKQQPMADRDHSPAFWRSVADRFKNNSSVLFEPYNEPYPDQGENSSSAWRCWRDGGSCEEVPFTAAGMQELVSAIRDSGATNIIILTGNNWGTQLDRWLEYKPSDPQNQLVAGWHSYGDGLDCEEKSCWDTVIANVLNQAPVLATEIGEFDCRHDHIDQVMNFLDSRGQGYLAWMWAPSDCARDPALLQDWSGTPTQTFGQGFKDHLR